MVDMPKLLEDSREATRTDSNSTPTRADSKTSNLKSYRALQAYLVGEEIWFMINT